MQEEEIETHGKPQVTRGANGAAHAAGSVAIADEIRGNVDGASRQHFNQSMRTITGDPTAPRKLPDAAVVHGSKVTLGEKVSPSQSVTSQTQKWSSEVGKTYTNSRTGQKLTVQAPVVRGLNILSLVPMISGTFSGRVNPMDPASIATAVDPTGSEYMMGTNGLPVNVTEQLRGTYNPTILVDSEGRFVGVEDSF
jgi:hypothetical protein